MNLEKRNVTLFGAAACVLIAAGWVGFSFVAKSPSIVSRGEESGEISRKTKLDRDRSGTREMLGAREALEKKRGEGMTNREVRWIAEDFLALGLDKENDGGTSAEGYLAMRRTRGEWFVKAMEEAYSLTKEQSAEARESIRVMEDEAFSKLQEYLGGIKPFEHEGKKYMIISGDELRKFTDAKLWLDTEGYQPWKLSTLSEEQAALTWQKESEASGGSSSWQDFISKGAFTFTKVSENELSLRASFEIPLLFSREILNGGRLVPFSVDQFQRIIPLSETGAMETLRMLHPSQLKYVLLRHPDMAGKILQQLDGT